MTKVVNLLAGPGSGKSTTAAGVFTLLKLHNVNCELVTEYAKDVVYRDAFKILKDQLFVLGKQNHRVFNLYGKIDVVITDSPILLSLVYADKNDIALRNLVKDRFFNQDNLNYFIRRVKPYSLTGRTQLESEAKEIDEKVRGVLSELNIPFRGLDGDRRAINYITEDVLTLLNKKMEFRIEK